MNKFQKVAVQMTKDDIKKGIVRLNEFKKCKNDYLNLFKERFEKDDIQDVLGFKNFNKCLSY